MPFFQCSIVFLGHVLSAEGISANTRKEEKVKNWLVPTNPSELQSFLGLASYYCHFIPNFAAIAKCLCQLVGAVNRQKTKMNKKINEPKVLFILSLGAQPFLIQACKVNFTSGILLQNSKFNYNHLSGHI